MVKFSLLRSMLDRWRVSYWVPEIVTVLRCQRFCDLNLMPGLFDAVQSRNIEQLHKAIEEGKVCNINEDDIREANDVLMEELRKARNQTKLQSGRTSNAASGTRRNSDKQTLTLKYFKFTDKFSFQKYTQCYTSVMVVMGMMHC